MAKPAVKPKVESLPGKSTSPSKPSGPGDNSVGADDLKSFYRNMLLIRRFEERAGQLSGMGKAGGLAGDRAQSEAQCGIEARTANAPIVQADALAFPVLQEQLPIVGVGKRLADMPFGAGAVEFRIGALKEQSVGGGERGHAFSYEGAGPDGAEGAGSRRLGGRRISAVVPLPGRLCSVRVPSCASISARDTYSPSPAP